MTISQLKRKATIQCIYYLLLSIVLIGLSTCFILYNKKVYNKNQTAAEEIHSINLQIIEIQKKEVVLNKNLDLWKRISSSNLHSSRYVTNLNFELHKLYKKHYMLEPEISISIPEEAELHNKSERTKVIRSEVVLNLSSISDKHIFLFLQSIPNLPGYVMIRSLTLNKQRNIDSAAINQILSGNMIEIVRASIVFDWYTILSR
ncbi:hypothetical protein wNo_04710 [Wolbachia endosymbiont of Drosophila simulans wNo]|uniref:hypothetical protein n=1 Tax=unclassified Wolbachia TaxID=2640676 RepID=UPI0002D24C11|nr:MULTISPECIES: hypothetical protein [unclassified Wolbachia]AGJ98894.1 hypothetical protein wNo_04710 [Wolbachia endosymbiont of Drosophila simulans wNo]QCB63058.1 hypothetical protein EJA99_05965 [Wolbachia endosymbiont of Drosophila mauritiana]QCB64104.1 hypothetical protein EJB00_05950 [Wolbachia endosymbiont of Drosophila mauritiana]QWE33546.1 Uncharacterized protein WwMa_06490 [Wolbachia endosymbiont of Drosophila simulans]TGB05935.1 hypothetical protein E5C28_05500 [Wolbachia endosymbi